MSRRWRDSGEEGITKDIKNAGGAGLSVDIE